jgi:predicted transposase YdaD
MPPSPHDHLFKAIFSRPTEAASFLQAHLPPELANSIRWDLLKCVKSGFEDADGTSTQADLLYTTRLQTDEAPEGVDIEIAILFEHQSSVDDRMPLRLLGYMLRTFEAQLAERGRKRPAPVIPIVLYHGTERWTPPTSFAEWMALPAGALARVAPFLPDFRYVLETPRPPRPDAYRGNDGVRFIRLLLDHARSQGFFDVLGEWRALLIRLDGDAGDQGVFAILALGIEYVYRVTDRAAAPLVKALNALGATAMQEIAMSTYQQAIDEGKQIGLSEGKQIGQLSASRAVLVRQCERRFGPLDEAVRQRIETADADTLMFWAENVVVAATLEEVFAGPLT